jgi:hypothetical protein
VVIATFLPIGVFVGLVNPPITNTAVSGMPSAMAGLAGSTASVGRQTGTALGVAIAGTVVGTAVAPGAVAFTDAAHGLWWMLVALGAAVVGLGLLSTGRRARATAQRAAALFDDDGVPTRADQRPAGRGPV